MPQYEFFCSACKKPSSTRFYLIADYEKEKMPARTAAARTSSSAGPRLAPSLPRRARNGVLTSRVSLATEDPDWTGS